MKLSDILDCVLSFFTLLIITLALSRIIGIKRFSFFFSFIISAIFTFVYARIKVKKRKVYFANAKEEKLLNKINLKLKMSDEKTNLEFLSELFTVLGYSHKKSVNKLIYKDYSVFILFKFEPLLRDEICSIYKKTNVKTKTVIFCSDLSEESKILVSNLNKKIIVLNDKFLFTLMKKVKFYPDVSNIPDKPKTKLKNVLTAFLQKKNYKRYIAYGLTLLFTSLFVFYPLIYVLIGSALCVLGLIGKFYGKTEEQEKVFP